MKIRVAHGDLKGSFTCLGDWYNLFNEKSMYDLSEMLSRVGVGDRKIARREIEEAKLGAEKWQRQPELWFLYDAANKQGDWSVKF